ncbi:MAG: PKD domain-containing protein [Armatimonadetes bacterium]|nr:PKD domain-containing protein [Armatimonadota bacterium]
MPGLLQLLIIATGLLTTGCHAATVIVSGNDTAAIAAAIEQSQPGDTILLPAGTYTLSASIAPKSETRLVGAGQDKTTLLLTGDKPTAFVSLSGVTDVTVSDLTLDGQNGPVAAVGVSAHDCRRLRLERLTIRNLAAEAFGPHGIHFNGENPTRQHGVTDSLIRDCTIENIAPERPWGAGIRLSWGSSRNQVLNCRISNTGRGGIFGDNGSTDLIIRGNTVSGSHGERLGIEVWGGCDRSLVEDNRIDHWLSIGGSDWCAVRRNTISCHEGCFGFCGIEAIGSFLVVTDNVVDDGQIIGLSVSSPLRRQYHYYGNNTFRMCSQWASQFQGESRGIQNHYLYRCRFADTTVGREKLWYPGFEGNGFRITGNTREMVLEECEMTGNGRLGMELLGAGVDCLDFVRCVVKGNKGAAMVPLAQEGQAGPPFGALEWRDCVVEGNGDNTLAPAAPFPYPPPTAGFSGPERVRVGEQVRLASTARAAAGPLKRIFWDLGDGIPMMGPRVRHVYPQPGTYTVTQIVWDTHGRGARAARPLVVTP